MIDRLLKSGKRLEAAARVDVPDGNHAVVSRGDDTTVLQFGEATNWSRMLSALRQRMQAAAVGHAPNLDLVGKAAASETTRSSDTLATHKTCSV